MISFEELTLAEIEEIELLANAPIDSVFQDGKPKGRGLRAFVYIIKRRENPNYKFEDTANVTQKEATKLLTGDNPKE